LIKLYNFMSLYEIQREVDAWAQQFKDPYWPIEWQLSQLQEEVGEVAREANHNYGPKRKKESEIKGSIAKELIDVLFVVACIANKEGIDLQKAWVERMGERLYKRDNQRFERKD